MTDVIDNESHHRYELADESGAITFANYRIEGDKVLITHVEAPLELRGSGSAGRLMQGILELTQAAGQTIVPICPYAVAWLRKHDYKAG